MKYNIIIEPTAFKDLQDIYEYISKNDSSSKAKKFVNEIKKQIYSLEQMPMRCRRSYYDESDNTRDLIYKGYTVTFNIVDSTIFVLSVFRQKNY